jgi:hypothetical protein
MSQAGLEKILQKKMEYGFETSGTEYAFIYELVDLRNNLLARGEQRRTRGNDSFQLQR